MDTQKNPKKHCFGVMKFIILEDPFLVIITIYLASLFFAWE